MMIITEMLKAAGEEGVELARQLAEAVYSCDESLVFDSLAPGRFAWTAI